MAQRQWTERNDGSITKRRDRNYRQNYLNKISKKWYKRHLAQTQRQLLREALAHQRYDSLVVFKRRVRWDLW